MKRIVALVGLVFACSSPADRPDGENDGGAPADAGATTPAQIVVVRDGVAVDGLVAVFHDAAGAVLTTTETDASGAAVGVAGAAQLTIALPIVGGQLRQTELFTVLAIEDGDQLRLDIGEGAPAQGVRTLAVTMPPAVSGASSYRLYCGCSSAASAEAGATLTLDVDSRCLDADGTLDVVAFAVDEVSDVLSASFELGVDPVAGSPVSLPAWNDEGFHYFSFGFSDGGLGRTGGTDASFLRASIMIRQTTKSGNTQRIRWPIADGFAETIQYSFQPPVGEPELGGFYRRRQYLGRRLPATEVEETFDLSATLLAPIDDAVTDSTDSLRPRLSWTRQGTSDDGDGVIVVLPWRNGDLEARWSVMAPGNSSSVQIPQLPDVLAAYRPTTDVGDPFVVVAESDVYDDYAAFRQDGFRLRRGPRFNHPTSERLRGSFLFPLPF